MVEQSGRVRRAEGSVCDGGLWEAMRHVLKEFRGFGWTYLGGAVRLA